MVKVRQSQVLRLQTLVALVDLWWDDAHTINRALGHLSKGQYVTLIIELLRLSLIFGNLFK